MLREQSHRFRFAGSWGVIARTRRTTLAHAGGHCCIKDTGSGRSKLKIPGLLEIEPWRLLRDGDRRVLHRAVFAEDTLTLRNWPEAHA